MPVIHNKNCDGVDESFNYAALDADTANETKDAAERIRVVLRNTTAGIIEVGERLIAVKDRLPHGQFTPWLAAEFGMSDRTARLYMGAAEWAAGKTEIVSVLQPTTVYALAAPSTPDTIKASLFERLEKGEAVTDNEVKQLIARQKGKKKHVDEAKFTGATTAKPEDHIWLVEPIKTDQEPAAPEVVVETDPLVVAIHAVESLSGDERAAFDRWYHDACPPVPGLETTDSDIVPSDDPSQSTLALERVLEQDEAKVRKVVENSNDQEKSSSTPERVFEPDVVEVQDDPLVVMWRDFKLNTKKCGRAWVLDGGPAEVSWDEQFLVKERLAPWRDAFRAAPPDRQESIRRWLEAQRI